MSANVKRGKTDVNTRKPQGTLFQLQLAAGAIKVRIAVVNTGEKPIKMPTKRAVVAISGALGGVLGLISLLCQTTRPW